MSKHCASLILLLLIQFAQCEKKDLYSNSGDVVILDGTNLKKTLLNQTSMWMVEYYSSWCGTCHEFAPIYRKLAKDISEWSYLFNVGVVDCSEKLNLEVCRNMSIVSTPTLRLYSSVWNGSYIGKPVEKIVSSQKIREEILPFIEEDLHNLNWNHDVPKPVFKPILYTEAMNYISSDDRALHLALVFEQSDSIMGKEMILDMSSCSNILVRRVNVESTDGKKLANEFSLDTSQYPHVVLLTDSQKPRIIDVKIKSRYFYVYQLEALPEVGKPKAKLVQQQIINVADSSQHFISGNSNIKIQPNAIKWERTYLADIESALNYMFTVEISANKKLDGKKLDAVKKLVQAFAETKENFPGRPPTRKFMENLHVWLQDKTSIPFSVWNSYLKSAEGFPNTSHMWIGCSSDQATLRGYPCGVWTTFHALSVACYNAQVKDEHLFYNAMTGYILNFFSCLECRNNFKNEIKKIKFDSRLDGKYASILWLWRLHNSVNERLHNSSTTEDKAHPKLQFPPQDICSNCKHPAVGVSKKIVKFHNQLYLWDEEQIVQYLIERYSAKNLLDDYLQVGEDSETEEKMKA